MDINEKKDVIYTQNVSGQFIPNINIQNPNREKS
jgi:hypothetical protein